MHNSTQNIQNPFTSKEGSENYANANFLYEQSALNAVNFFAPTKSGENLKIVDLGAGTGVSARILIEHGAKDITLIDPSLVMLEQAKEKLSEAATYIQAGAEGFSQYFNGDIDVIYALNCFHLFADIPLILSQIKEASKKNAHFVFNLSMPSFCFEKMDADEILSVKANRDFYANLNKFKESPLVSNTVLFFDKILAEKRGELTNKDSIEAIFQAHGFKMHEYAEHSIQGDAKAQKIIWELVSTCLIENPNERKDFLDRQIAPEKMIIRQAFFDMLVNDD